MTWTAPDVTRAAWDAESRIAPEPEMVRGSLDRQRATLLYKCAGLSGGQLAMTPIPGCNLSLLGLLRHMAKVERVWFRVMFRRETVDQLYSTPDRPDADFEDLDPAQAEADYQCLLAEQESSRQIVAGESLDKTFVSPSDNTASLRLVFEQMITEYARHNGHADLIRQCVDGATGF